MMKTNKTILSLLVLLISASAYSQTRTVTNSGLWKAAGNWQNGLVGGAVDNNDDVIMNDATDIVIESGESYTISTFTVGKGGSLTINTGGVLIITGPVLTGKEFIINVDGELIIGGDLDVAKDLQLNVTGALTVVGSVLTAKDARMNIQGVVEVEGDFITDKDAVVIVDGTLDITGDLNLGSGSLILGSGPVTAGSCSGDACDDNQLPVELVYFRVVTNEKTVELTWTTASEENNDYFTLERSVDGIVYKEVTTIKGAGNSTDLLTYEFVDNYPLFGRSYYRLKQTDFDEQSEIFAPVSVYMTDLQHVQLLPNPVARGGQLEVFTEAQSDEEVIVNIYNPTGIVVLSKSLQGGHETMDISNALLPGLYVAKIESGNTQAIKRLLIK